MRVAIAISNPDTLARVRAALRGSAHTTVAADEPCDLLIVDDEALPALQDQLARQAIDTILIGTDADRCDFIAQLELPIDPTRLRSLLADLGDAGTGPAARDLVSAEALLAGDSQAIRGLDHRLSLMARSVEPVCIHGDDGSGRAVVARVLHERGPVRDQPFLAVSGAADTDDALESRLFGDQGALAIGSTGTVFVDRLGMTTLPTQRKLLQCVQTPPRARLVVGMRPGTGPGHGAPNVLPDLYYRVKVLEVEIPPLRQRAQDLDAIVERMLGGERAITRDALRVFQRYSFPGNLVELAHALLHASVVANGKKIDVDHLPPSIRREANESAVTNEAFRPLDEVVKEFERDYVLQVVRAVRGNRARAAAILGLSRKGLWGKLKTLAITNEDILLGSE